MPYPRHEAELELEAWRNCGRMCTHPSEIPSICSNNWRQTRDYFAARDVVDLDREELIELISWTRKMAMKLTGYALFLGFLVAVAVAANCKTKER